MCSPGHVCVRPLAALRSTLRGVAKRQIAYMLGLTVGMLATCVSAADVLVSAFDVRGGAATVAFPSDTNDYYVLVRAMTPTGAWQSVVAGQWSTATGRLVDTQLPPDCAFYRVVALPVASAGDMDGDGIPDLYELAHPGFLNPLDPADASADYDWDGLSNLEEYLLGSDPADPGSPNPTAGLRITALRLNGPRDEVEFQSATGNYYILLAGLTVTNLTAPVAMGFGLPGRTTLVGARLPTRFYCVKGVHNDTPLDTDGDGMDDVFELLHGLNPLQADGQEDADGDGYPNFYEYLYGSAPDDPASKPVPTRYVDAAALPGGDGSEARPHASLAEALAAATNYDIIGVADGVYTGPLNRNLSCDGKPLLIISQHGPTNCVIDCGWEGQAFLLDARDGAYTFIVGLTVRNGYGPNGGALSCDGASAVIDGCRFETSLADACGGGVTCTSGGAPLFRNCTFASNSAWFGGGLCVTAAAATFTNCQLIGNGAVCGGGAYCLGDGPVFRRCTFADNRATEGAGLFCDHSSLQLRACRVQGGVADDCGGGVYCLEGSPLCENGLFTANEAATAGGAFYITNASPVLRNCTVADNCALLGGGVACADVGSSPQVVNCILWGNRIGQFVGGTPCVTFSTVEGGCAAAGLADPPSAHNLALDPLFNADYRLQTASPCIDAGTAENAPATDITGAARWDHPGHSNVVSIVDLGAYEFVDTDSDGMDDNWELQNFGTLLRDGSGDWDGDGLTDLNEYEAGTDPTRPDTAADVFLATHPGLELDMPDVDQSAKTNVFLLCSDATQSRNVLACLNRAFSGGSVTLQRNSNRINVWRAAGTTPVLVGGILSKTWDLADASQRADFMAVQGDLWVQGVTPGTATLTLSYTFMPDATDRITFSVVKAAVTNIRFNHDASASTNDAMNIRKSAGGAYDLSGGEWVNGGKTNAPVCYRAGTLATVQARFVIQPTNLTCAVIAAVVLNADASLSGIQPTRVSFTNGVSNPEYVTLRLAGPAPSAVRKSADVWQWQMSDFNGGGSPALTIGTSGVHTVYTVLDEPVAPWTNAVAAAHAPWSSVLDQACDWAAGATNADDVVAALTPHAYAGFGKVYDGSQSHSFGTTCHLSAMLADSVADCQDMSAVLQLFSAALGVSGVQVRRVGGPFMFQPLQPIGQTVWTSGSWRFHQFGWYEGTVNDACTTLREAAPYVPVHDDLDGNYRNNLFSSGTWLPLDPSGYTDFD